MIRYSLSVPRFCHAGKKKNILKRVITNALNSGRYCATHKAKLTEIDRYLMNTKKRREVVHLQQSQPSAVLTSQIGMAISLIFDCANYRQLRVASVGAWLRPPIHLRQICFFHDNIGYPIGYITWAYLAPDVEERMIANSNFFLHTSEWNEGERLWIIDFVAPRKMVSEIVSYIRRNMFKEFDEVRYVRRFPSGDIRKICKWRLPSNRVS